MKIVLVLLRLYQKDAETETSFCEFIIKVTDLEVEGEDQRRVETGGLTGEQQTGSGLIQRIQK